MYLTQKQVSYKDQLRLITNFIARNKLHVLYRKVGFYLNN